MPPSKQHTNVFCSAGTESHNPHTLYVSVKNSLQYRPPINPGLHQESDYNFVGIRDLIHLCNI